MNIEKQRIAIAQACGKANQWNVMKHGLYYRPKAQGYTSNVSKAGIYTEEEAKKHVYPHDEPVTMHRAPLLDYLNSLDAMAEAEKILSEEDVHYYGIEVVKVMERTGSVSIEGDVIWGKLLMASASQKSEAFLRLKKLWKTQ